MLALVSIRRIRSIGTSLRLEELDVLQDAVFVDGEVVTRQIGDEPLTVA